MPPVPVHIEDPISPTQGRAPELQAQTQLEPSSDIPAHNPATTTATPTSTYPQATTPARAGAAAVPAPTTPASRSYPTPTRTYPQQTTSEFPPPPQPGAAPSIANGTAFHATATGGLPSQPLTSIVPPPQSQYSPPEQNLAPTHTTQPYTPQGSTGGPTTLNLGPVITPSAQHPPGYVQNAYAQELNSAQRTSLDMQQERERQENGGGLLGTPSKSGNGVAGGAPESVGEAWDTMKSWSGDAGRRMSQLAGEAHNGVWKWINKES